MDKGSQNKKPKLQFKMIRRAMLVFLAMALVLLLRQKNVTYEPHARILPLLSETDFPEESSKEKADCLFIWNSEDDQSVEAHEEMLEVLGEMRISSDGVDLAEEGVSGLENYHKVILGITDYGSLGERLYDLEDWVKNGGSLLVLYPPSPNRYFQSVQNRMGIMEVGTNFYKADRLRFLEEVMIGGMEKSFGIMDAYEGSVTVRLRDDCQVYIVSDDEAENPLLWRSDYGSGKIIFNNIPYAEKAYRGFYAASYSLLGDGCAWPVINGSSFYLDDFPSPVPGGSSEYVARDYGMDVKTFYTNVWWPDVQNLAKKYGIRFTGLAIEEYSDQTEPPFDRNGDVTRYRYFGNQLLDDGGEIGFHGYNHMPLVLESFDYKGQFDTYKKWKSVEDMRLSMEELSSFCGEMFPDEQFQVYVPPSNILSQEGRKMLKEDFPGIKAIASSYFPGEFEYSQEFEVAKDGMVETPRIISGYILNDYMKTAALSELNMHYVNSHFQHPDDVLDVDRGASLGWEELHKRLSSYVGWLYESAPDIRNLTGSEMAAAVQRFYHLGVDQEIGKDQIQLNLSGFVDEAWLLVRINDGRPGEVTGGTVTEAAKDLYLLHALEPTVRISIERTDDHG